MVRASRFRFRCATSLVTTLALAACTDAPTAASTRATRAIGHTSTTLIDAASPNTSAIIVSPDEAVTIDVGGVELTGRFHSNLHIGDGGEASGSARLVYDVPGGDRSAQFVLIITFTNAALVVTGGTFEARVEGEGELCSGGVCDTFPISGTIAPDPAEDCLIYDILGPPDRTLFEAHGKLIVPSAA